MKAWGQTDDFPAAGLRGCVQIGVWGCVMIAPDWLEDKDSKGIQSESALTAMLTVIGIHTSGYTPRGESSKLLKENVLTRSQIDKAFEKWNQL